MVKKLLLSLFVTILFYSCSSVTKIYVSNTGALKSLEDNSYIYALPRTVLKISVTVNKSVFTPGPYNKYAGKYLGITGAGDKQYESWTLETVSVEPYVEVDPEHFYSLKSPHGIDGFEKSISGFETSGLILTPCQMQMNQALNYMNNSAYDEEIIYTDLSVKRNLVSEKQTTYKRVLKDSIYVQVPVVNEQTKTKSVEQKAEEAANFIYKLRKRKFKLLTGQSDTGIGEKNMKASIEELNRIEQEYLALFLGKTINEKFTRSFNYIPDASKENDQAILFKMSDIQGIVDAKIPGGKPVILEIKTLALTKSLKKLQTEDVLTIAENAIFYRIPERAVVSIKEDNKMLIEGEISVFQYGALVNTMLAKDK